LKGYTIKERLAVVLAEKLGCEVDHNDFWVQFPGTTKAHPGIARWGWDPNYRVVDRSQKRVVSWGQLQLMPDHDLHGPTCPFCDKPFRRRRYWCRWDMATCSGCGATAECIDAWRGEGRTWVFAPPPTRQKRPRNRPR
jgi:hypothetical protein